MWRWPLQQLPMSVCKQVLLYLCSNHKYKDTYVCTYEHMYIPTYICINTHSYTNPCRHSHLPHTYVVSSLLLLYRHRPLQSHAFIPYSHWLGGILRDIHRVLLLAASTEGNSKTLVQILKVHLYCKHISTNAPMVVQQWVCVKCC